MNELLEIAKRAIELRSSGSEGILATIVKTEGSSYRGPGARLLIARDRSVTGTLSGGCLEADLRERSKPVFQSGSPLFVTYDTSSSKDIVFGLGLGCAGSVHLLLEPLREAGPVLDFVSKAMYDGVRCVVATVFRVRGFPDVPWGARIMMRERSEPVHSIQDPGLASVMEESCRRALSSRRTFVETYELAGSFADALVEHLEPPLQLLILGRGPGYRPLARIAGELGWEVTVADHKPAPKDTDFVHRVIEADLSEMNVRVPIGRRTAAVLLSHNFLSDLEYLKVLLPSAASYIGLLGARTRSEQLLKKLEEEGITLRREQLDRLYSPVGLDIGADSPEEIALSIVAEIRAVFSGRPGRSLKERKDPIHDR